MMKPVNMSTLQTSMQDESAFYQKAETEKMEGISDKSMIRSTRPKKQLRGFKELLELPSQFHLTAIYKTEVKIVVF